MKIQVTTSSFGKAGPKPTDYLKEFDVDLHLNPYGRTLTESEAIEVINDADALIAGTEPLSENVIKALPNLKVISRCGTGMDSVDTEAAKKKNIKVFNTPDVHVDSVAELALGGILAAYRNISMGDRRIREGNWTKLMGKSLFKKQVGIIGYGKVGKKLVDLLRPFSVSILIYDPMIDENSFKEDNFKVVGLDELIQNSDVISIHAPYNKSTHDLLNERSFNNMKNDVTLVNTARGGIVNETALYKFLNNNSEASAFLDVFSKEPYSGKLVELENITLTPHVASRTRQTREEMEFQAAKNLIKAFENNA